ncbi:hypothetical protein Glove_236g35 [Diversispora epigaea]|uniref:Endonuclease/exonuclease/phosphatase domain-containing protein n=1 Tax=Diversispora epigaea TaxID=1348612 RepID=A0A397IGF0_9GLOM|nr:hypothetical protein Glove_236g35 [Diversispora epigaea]
MKKLSRNFKESNKGGYGPSINSEISSESTNKEDSGKLSIDSTHEDYIHTQTVAETETSLPTDQKSNKGGYGPSINSEISSESTNKEDSGKLSIDSTHEDYIHTQTVAETETSLPTDQITQNINGLNDKLKQTEWWDYCTKKQFDIIFLTETRLKRQNTKGTFLENKLHTKQHNLPYYECFWSSDANNSRKAGVGGKITFHIIGIYEHANKIERATSGKALTSWKHHAAIILGDFNGVVNPTLDRINSKLRKTETRTLETIISKGFQDCYRLMKGKKCEFTFTNKDQNHNRKAISRLDQIWITMNQAEHDHDAMAINLSNQKYTKNRQYNKNRTTTKQWEDFEEAMEQYTGHYTNEENSTEQEINSQWSFIKCGIISKGREYLTKAKEPYNQMLFNWHKHPSYGTMRLLRKICKLENLVIITQQATGKQRSKFLQLIASAQDKQPDLLQKFPDQTNRIEQISWFQDTYSLLTKTRKLVTTEIKKEQLQQIRKWIKDREQNLKENPKRMINNPEQIKKQVRIHLQNWPQNGKTLPENINEFWTNQYMPQSSINDNVFDTVIQPITLDFFNNILRTGHTPTEWSFSNVILILKPKDWEGQLEIMRPITLIETARKLFTKIINLRLATTLSENNILNHSNYHWSNKQKSESY